VDPSVPGAAGSRPVCIPAPDGGFITHHAGVACVVPAPWGPIQRASDAVSWGPSVQGRRGGESQPGRPGAVAATASFRAAFIGVGSSPLLVSEIGASGWGSRWSSCSSLRDRLRIFLLAMERREGCGVGEPAGGGGDGRVPLVHHPRC
jgi:hypothetical protein